eukprot:9800005-Lingulodinium_polyedra.AAC.1
MKTLGAPRRGFFPACWATTMLTLGNHNAYPRIPLQGFPKHLNRTLTAIEACMPCIALLTPQVWQSPQTTTAAEAGHRSYSNIYSRAAVT